MKKLIYPTDIDFLRKIDESTYHLWWHKKQSSFNILILFFLTFVSISIFGQKVSLKKETKSSIFPIDTQKADFHSNLPFLNGEINKNNISVYLKNKLSNLRHSTTDILFENKIKTTSTKHYSYIQTINNIEIYRSQIKINIANNGRVLSILDNSYPPEITKNLNFPNEKIAVNFINNSTSISKFEIKKKYFFLDNKLTPCLYLKYLTTTDIYQEIIFNTNGTIIYQNDLNTYLQVSTKDTTISGTVFLPDPLTKGLKIYAAPYVDALDSDIVELNNLRDTISVQATFNIDSNYFELKSPFVKIEEHSAPNIPAVISTDTTFYFTRKQSGFEDINAFYHINTYQQYIRSLGFNNLVNFPIPVDTHGLNGSDNSGFSSNFNNPRLQFGEGGVDDAEDADVIIHEYAHAISYSAAPETNSGGDRQALDEGFGDYLAASYSRSINDYNWQNVFSWDGHNEYWAGRLINTTKVYPIDKVNEIHEDGEIWSSALMQAWSEIGGTTTDQILLQSMFSYSTNMSMKNAATLFIQTDSVLNNGANYIALANNFFVRGLYDFPTGINPINSISNNIELINTEGFAKGNSNLKIKGIIMNTPLLLYNSNGQLIKNYSYSNDGISPRNLKPGIYILKITELNNAFKIVRF